MRVKTLSFFLVFCFAFLFLFSELVWAENIIVNGKNYFRLGIWNSKTNNELVFDFKEEKIYEYDKDKNTLEEAKISNEARQAILQAIHEATVKAAMKIFSTPEGWQELKRLAEKEPGEKGRRIREAFRNAELKAQQITKFNSVDYTAYLINKLVEKKYGDKTPENYMKAFEELRHAAATGQLDRLIFEIELLSW